MRRLTCPPTTVLGSRCTMKVLEVLLIFSRAPSGIVNFTQEKVAEPSNSSRSWLANSLLFCYLSGSFKHIIFSILSSFPIILSKKVGPNYLVPYYQKRLVSPTSFLFLYQQKENQCEVHFWYLWKVKINNQSFFHLEHELHKMYISRF